jgi:D-amino peptidase
MNIYIFVDMEGISGIYEKDQCSPIPTPQGLALTAADIKACAEGCREAGAGTLYMRFAHGRGTDSPLLWEYLGDSVDYIILGPTGECIYPGLDDCDGVILLGCHAMAGTRGAILDHSFNSTAVQNMWLNGKKTGEIGVFAAICGEAGKPVLMVSGDDKACAEAASILPWAELAEVKKGLTCQGGILAPPGRARALIREKAKAGVEHISSAKPYTVDKPVKLKVEHVERAEIPGLYSKPYITILDDRTYEITASSVEEALFRR